MKKSEFKQLIRECISEVFQTEENQPFKNFVLKVFETYPSPFQVRSRRQEFQKYKFQDGRQVYSFPDPGQPSVELAQAIKSLKQAGLLWLDPTAQAKDIKTPNNLTHLTINKNGRMVVAKLGKELQTLANEAGLQSGHEA